MKRLHAPLRANVAINVTAICKDACNVAEIGSISTFGTLQETLHATSAKPVTCTRINSVVACNVACNVSSCDSAFKVVRYSFHSPRAHAATQPPGHRDARKAFFHSIKQIKR